MRAMNLLRSPTTRWLAIAAVAVAGAIAFLGLRERWPFRGAAADEAQSGGGKATLGFAAGAEAGGSVSAEKAGIATVPVEVVRRADLLRVTGTLLAEETSAVASNASGIVSAVYVDRGSVVKKNQLLVQIDPRDAENKLAEGRAVVEELKARLSLEDSADSFDPEQQPEVRLAKAALDLAETHLKRIEKLREQKYASEETYDTVQTECELAANRYRQALCQVKQAYQSYKTALARLAILQKAVDDAAIRAPFGGVVVERHVSLGEYVNSGPQSSKVVTLVQIDSLRLSLSVPQQSVGCICAGQKVQFQVDAFPGRTFAGTIRYVSPTVTADTRSLVVEAVVPNAEGMLRPGLFATAQIELPEQNQRLYVPATAVQRIADVARVFVVRDGVACEQVVALGPAEQQRVEVKSGLTGQERIVARPELVRDGDVVRP